MIEFPTRDIGPTNLPNTASAYRCLEKSHEPLLREQANLLVRSPAAVVKVRSDDTGVLTDLTTNEAGAYSSPSLVLGAYTITVESAGFKTAVRPGIRLVGGQIVRQDI